MCGLQTNDESRNIAFARIVVIDVGGDGPDEKDGVLLLLLLPTPKLKLFSPPSAVAAAVDADVVSVII